jgi:hypothetical protein
MTPRTTTGTMTPRMTRFTRMPRRCCSTKSSVTARNPVGAIIMCKRFDKLQKNETRPVRYRGAASGGCLGVRVRCKRRLNLWILDRSLNGLFDSLQIRATLDME